MTLVRGCLESKLTPHAGHFGVSEVVVISGKPDIRRFLELVPKNESLRVLEFTLKGGDDYTVHFVDRKNWKTVFPVPINSQKILAVFKD